MERELLAPLVPRGGIGRPPVDDRRILNGVVFKSRTGIAWRDLPERYGLGRRSADASGAMSYDHGPNAGALRAEGTGTAEIRLRLRRFSGWCHPSRESRTCPPTHLLSPPTQAPIRPVERSVTSRDARGRISRAAPLSDID
ncbi:transposase [Streptomyces decoyicus]|uniref:transposase n=1 Tax=Streptomyces decoyicus TaxID=249567 RepID=UPI003825EF8A